MSLKKLKVISLLTFRDNSRTHSLTGEGFNYLRKSIVYSHSSKDVKTSQCVMNELF